LKKLGFVHDFLVFKSQRRKKYLWSPETKALLIIRFSDTIFFFPFPMNRSTKNSTSYKNVMKLQ